MVLVLRKYRVHLLRRRSIIKIIPPDRGQDCHGSGAYLASRGSRTHNGVDKACLVGSVVLSCSVGLVTKIGIVYSDPEKARFRYVQVTNPLGYNMRFFYLDPCVSVGDEIGRDQPLGTVQELPYEGITPHFHFEVKKDGKYIDPNKFLESFS
jgi:murein DD-endopeptidase MepM/ murein hydrolase activator NlpD